MIDNKEKNKGMFSEIEFDILNNLYKHTNKSLVWQPVLQKYSCSFKDIQLLLKKMITNNLICKDMSLTAEGSKALEPYKVKNAVIMAAGMSTRFAPLSYEKPKALLKVKGELLIERELRQLQEAGITDIIVVVGYMKEKLFYLAEKYNIKIVVNEDYYRYNNTSTLMLVADRLNNTYICSSDNYFTENPFEQYVYHSYYSSVYTKGETDEYCISYNQENRITKVEIGGMDSWCMLGHVYFDCEFCKKFVPILKNDYKKKITKSQLWEDVYIRHIDKLDMYIRKYNSDVIQEFDCLEELRLFDKNYLVYSDSKIFKNICDILKCAESDIVDIYPIKTGLTNLSFCFLCKGKKYVYRHPGVGTDAYINRASEAESMRIAKKLGLDDTYIYIHPKAGWKISYYIEEANLLDYHNSSQVEHALCMLRTLHTSKEKTNYFFDVWQEIDKFETLLEKSNRTDFEDMSDMSGNIARLRIYLDRDQMEKTICHCDSYSPNFLIDKNHKMYLIDWEYSGMSDPGVDIGTFIACSDYELEEAQKIIEIYLQHLPSKKELCHFMGYIAVSSFYWFVWALYQDSIGKTVGEYLYMWYRYTKKYSKKALELYENNATNN